MNNVKGYFLSTIVAILFLAGPAQASIVMKIMCANPSKTQSQKVAVKTYLPKETKPEDIVDKADLDVTYDTQQGSYFVHGEYDLKPGETLEKDVELKDIWVVSTSEIESLRLEALKLEKMLKNTEFNERVGFLGSSVESKLSQINDNQSNPPANPERHISDYRDNVKMLESAKADMLLMRSLLTQSKTLPTILIWRLIFAIVVFLGFLGITFYFIWHKQLKIISETFPAQKEEPIDNAIEQKRKQ